MGNIFGLFVGFKLLFLEKWVISINFMDKVYINIMYKHILQYIKNIKIIKKYNLYN
jgi:hypothetical protein